MNASPAYIQFSKIFLSEQAAAFMNTCPLDDAELIVQDAIDNLLFKILGDSDAGADFSPLLEEHVPVYAMHTELEEVSRTFPVTLVADFRNNGLRYTENPNSGMTEAYEIDACIYIAAPSEMEKMLEGWQRSSGSTPTFVN